MMHCMMLLYIILKINIRHKNIYYFNLLLQYIANLKNKIWYYEILVV